MKVGFIISFSGNNNWIGGRNYSVNLFHALKALPNPKVEPVILTAPQTADSAFADFPATQIIRSTLFDTTRKDWLARKVFERFAATP